MVKIPKYKGLVDVDSFVYRVGFACDKKGENLAVTMRTLDSAIKTAVSNAGCNRKILCITNGKTFRDKVATILPYKGNRNSEHRPRWYSQMRMHLNNQELGQCVQVPDHEADDALAMFSVDGTVMITIDKDLDTVPGLHYNWVREELYDVLPGQARYNFWEQMIKGDNTDNIQGLRGMRLRSKNVLDECNTDEEYYNAVLPHYEKMYGEDYLEAFMETAALLWMKRDINDGPWFHWDMREFTDAEVEAIKTVTARI